VERVLRKTLKDGKFQNVDPVHSRRMSAVRSRGNKSTEGRLRSALIRAGITGWTVNPTGLTGNPDFYFPFFKVAIFVDGCFWHGCPQCGHVPSVNNAYWATKLRRNIERDSLKTKLLKHQGIKVLRFWEHKVQADIDACLSAIQIAVKNNR
jgi:DNA mismatch endonuclease Vsr